MIKPASLRRKDLIDNITKLINESGLPPYVIEPILDDLRRQAHELTRRQLQVDLEQWEAGQKKEAKINVNEDREKVVEDLG